VPPEGLKVGEATFGRLIMYVAEARSLSIQPLLKALALTVVVVFTEMGVLYSGEEDEGSVPSTV